MPGNYSIQVWSFPVLAANSPVSHRFMVIVDAIGKVEPQHISSGRIDTRLTDNDNNLVVNVIVPFGRNQGYMRLTQ
jgi:hypothetical protein